MSWSSQAETLRTPLRSKHGRAEDQEIERSSACVLAIDEMLQRAFELAYFLHDDRAIALQIVLQAFAKLQVATSAQKKRLYYIPTGRFGFDKSKSASRRSKVKFTEPHLLQRLVYIESEPFERQLEDGQRGRSATKADLIVFFIKHLIRVTLKRNSFYVTLGLCRLLYDYGTASVMNIYSVVIQDPDRVKDDYYYRSRKAVLISELKERFGSLITTYRGPRGEERFERQEHADEYQALVDRCLSIFTPWRTPCPLPAVFNPMTDEIPLLVGRGSREEEDAELNRLHAVMHPSCFKKLIEALNLEPPQQRLAVPLFQLSDREDDARRDPRGGPNRLSDVELEDIKKQIVEQAARRKKFRAVLLRVFVDGTERASIDASHTKNVRFSIAEDAELVEVRSFDRSSGGYLPLASCFLNSVRQTGAGPSKTAIVLEGGQHIKFSISQSAPELNEFHRTIEVSYREPKQHRLLSLFWPTSLISSPARFRKAYVYLGTAIMALLLVTGLIAALYFRRQDPRAVSRSTRSVPAQPEHNPSPQQTHHGSGSQSTNDNESGSRDGREGNRIARKEPSPAVQSSPSEPDRSNPQAQEDTTRGHKEAIQGLPLSRVKTIYVSVSGDAFDAHAFSAILGQKFGSRFTITGNADASDAHLKVFFNASGPTARAGSVSVSMQLVNANGEVLWPSRPARLQKYSGTLDRIAEASFQDLLRSISRSESLR